MKPFRWSPEKNDVLKGERGVSFESMVVAIEGGGLLDILAHPNEQKYPRQRILVVAHDSYAYLVPFVEEDDYFFLKTAPCHPQPQGNQRLLEPRSRRCPPKLITKRANFFRPLSKAN